MSAAAQRYTFLAMGGGASVSNTVEGDSPAEVEAYARDRFRETWGRPASFVEVAPFPSAPPSQEIRTVVVGRTVHVMSGEAET